MYRKVTQGFMKHMDFMIWDLVCIQLSFLIAYMIRHGIGNPYLSSLYRNVLLSMTFIDIIVVILCSFFKNILKRGMYVEFINVVKQDGLVILLSTCYLFLIQSGSEFSRMTLFLTGGIYLVIANVVRYWWKRFVKKRMANNNTRSVLYVTTKRMVDQLQDEFTERHFNGINFTGIVLLDNESLVGSKIQTVPVVTSGEGVLDYVCTHWVGEIFLNIPEGDPYPEKLSEQFTDMGIVVHRGLARKEESSGEKQIVERFGNYTVLTTTINYASGRQLLAKRILDICGGLVGCLITGILFVFLAPAIYHQSPGPIFFKQTRIGKNGKTFQMYKFRSMYMDAEERKKELMAQNRVKDGMMFKLEWDPRIIGTSKLPDGTIKKGIGNYIRDYSLDEFPQFFNVLKGDMSLVGTRPPTQDEWRKYDLHHRARMATKPGVTGMWQVSGRSNITDFEDVVRLDTKYIKEWSFGLDLRILWKTVMVVWKKEGSM